MNNNHPSWNKKVIPWGILMVCLGASGTSFGQYGGGSGTSVTPYLIYTPSQFNAIGIHPADWDKRFKLMADIDLSSYTGTQYNRIGTDSEHAFRGVLDGNDHIISNFTYGAADTNNVGLVGYLSANAVIKNLGLVGVHVTGNLYVGGLVGRTASYKGTISNCFVSGSVSGDRLVGGLVGWGSDRLIVTNCYAVGSVSGMRSVGGLVGETLGAVVNCYAAGSVSGTEQVGGLMGAGTEAVNSFWDVQISELTTSAGGRGRTTQQMMQAGNYVGWNSDGQVDWMLDEGKDYPHLAWEGKSCQPIPSLTLSDFLTGSGTADDPYLVSTAEHYNHIGHFPSQWHKHYRLMADIDLAGTEPVMIGVSSANAFIGILDGNSHTISNFMYDANSSPYAGLVGYLDREGVVQDLGLVGVHVTGAKSVGGLVGYNYYGTVTHCYSSGMISGTEYVGGLVGRNIGGTVRNCYSSGSVSGDRIVGGLVGSQNGTIANCYASGSVSGGNEVGGLLGENNGTASSCYASGPVSGDRYVGGLVGLNGGTRSSPAVIHCYSYGPVSGNPPVGGLVGAGDPWPVENSFWDIQTSGQSTSTGGEGKTTIEMWDFDTYLYADWELHWFICDGKDYPRLWWENPSCN